MGKLVVLTEASDSRPAKEGATLVAEKSAFNKNLSVIACLRFLVVTTRRVQTNIIQIGSAQAGVSNVNEAI